MKLGLLGSLVFLTVGVVATLIGWAIEACDPGRSDVLTPPYAKPDLTAKLRAQQAAHHTRVMRLIRGARC